MAKIQHAEGNARAKCTQVIIAEGGGVSWGCSRRGKGGTDHWKMRTKRVHQKALGTKKEKHQRWELPIFQIVHVRPFRIAASLMLRLSPLESLIQMVPLGLAEL